MSFIPQVYATCDPGQAGLNLGDCLTLKSGNTVADVYSTPASVINTVLPNLFVASGVILFLTIFLAGFKFISQGTKGKDEAKQILVTAVIGLVVMIIAYWVVQIVGIITGADIRF